MHFLVDEQTKWDEGFRVGRDYNPMNEILLDLILDKVENDKKNAIDLSCGTGDAVMKLAKRGMTVTGTDWSPEALRKAQERAEAEGVAENINLREVDLNFLPEANLNKGCADIILCNMELFGRCYTLSRYVIHVCSKHLSGQRSNRDSIVERAPLVNLSTTTKSR